MSATVSTTTGPVAQPAGQRWVHRNPGPSVAVILGVTALVVVLAFYGRGQVPIRIPLVLASYILGLTLAGVIIAWVSVVVGIGGGKLSQLVIGMDGRASTSKFQYLLWTVGVATAMCIIGARAFLDQDGSSFACVADSSTYCVPDNDTWQAYLALLGVPAAAAVVAKASVSAKTEAGDLQKTAAPTGAKVADLGTNDAGSADLIDIQYLVFNLIAFGYFAAKFVATGTFASIPTILTGLTSASAATYMATKVTQRNRPTLTSVQPTTLRAGDRVTVKGVNLVPDANAKGAENVIQVSVGGRPAEDMTVFRSSSSVAADTLTFTAPTGMSATDAAVVVTTSAGVATNPFPITVSSAEVLGWVDSTPSVGSEGRLRVSGLPPKGAVEVRMGWSVVSARADRPNGTVSFTVPPLSVSGQQQKVAVLVGGLTIAEGEVDVRGA